MNSFERVEAALNFDSPDKVPIWKNAYADASESDVFILFNTPSKDCIQGGLKKKKDYSPIQEKIC